MQRTADCGCPIIETQRGIFKTMHMIGCNDPQIIERSIAKEKELIQRERENKNK